jgi:hypothetical protein
VTDRHYQRVDAAIDAGHLERRTAAIVRAAELNGAHVWCVMTAFLVPDPATVDGMALDRDNMMVYPTVGCFRCEEAYEPRLRLRRCPGDPR